MLAASVVSFVSIPLFGHLSDRIGRKNMYMIGAAVTGVFGFIYFGMLNTGVASIIFLAIVLSLIPHDMMYGPQAALIAESFTGRLRYSGASLGYQLASIIAGGPAPLIATWLFGTYHTPYAIAVYIAICAVVSLVATALMTDYTGKDIEAEYDLTTNVTREVAMIKWRDEVIYTSTCPSAGQRRIASVEPHSRRGAGDLECAGRISLGAINKPDHRIAAQLPAVQR